MYRRTDKVRVFVCSSKHLREELVLDPLCEIEFESFGKLSAKDSLVLQRYEKAWFSVPPSQVKGLHRALTEMFYFVLVQHIFTYTCYINNIRLNTE